MSPTRRHDPPLPYLETFVKAAELASFTAAAKSLGLTQAGVSQRIAALEHALGGPVFDRQSGHVALTDAGQRLLPFAQRILALHEEALRAISGASTELGGALSLAASSIPGEHLLPPMLSDFQRRYPAVRVRVAIADSRAVVQAVTDGAADLGLVGDKSAGQHLDFCPFATDEMVVIVPREHPWSRRRRVPLTDLAAQPLILRQPGSGSRRCLEQALAQAGESLSGLRVALELGSNEAIKQAVRQGLGVSVVSMHAVDQELRSGSLHAVRVSDLPLRRELFTVRDKRRPLPSTARAFLEFCGGAA